MTRSVSLSVSLLVGLSVHLSGCLSVCRGYCKAVGISQYYSSRSAWWDYRVATNHSAVCLFMGTILPTSPIMQDGLCKCTVL